MDKERVDIKNLVHEFETMEPTRKWTHKTFKVTGASWIVVGRVTLYASTIKISKKNCGKKTLFDLIGVFEYLDELGCISAKHTFALHDIELNQIEVNDDEIIINLKKEAQL